MHLNWIWSWRWKLNRGTWWTKKKFPRKENEIQHVKLNRPNGGGLDWRERESDESESESVDVFCKIEAMFIGGVVGGVVVGEGEDCGNILVVSVLREVGY